MKLLMWILLTVTVNAKELQHDSICQIARTEDIAKVTCTYNKNVYQEKVDIIVHMFAANSSDSNIVASCLWTAKGSVKPDCKCFYDAHLDENITNVVAIEVPINRLPAGGGRFMCQMVIPDRNDFLPCSWTEPEPQSTATSGISNTSTSTGEQCQRTDPSSHCNLAMGAHIFGTFIVTVLLYSLVLVILWYKRVIQYNRRLCWKHRTRGEKTKTEEPKEDGKLRSAEETNVV